ncbi:MAG: O-antigen ligase family protein [Iamia sp.]
MTTLPVQTNGAAAATARPWDVAPPRAVAMPRWMALLGLVLVEAAIGVAAARLPQFGALHGLGVTVVAAYALLKRDVVISVCVLAYLPGSEILWRQSRSAVPYQWGPYLAIGICLFCLVLVVARTGRSGKLALGYLALLIPGVVLTISTAGAQARSILSFALAGPFVLAAGVGLMSQLRVAPWLYRRILWIVLIGAVGPLAFALTSIQDYIVNTGSIDFATESNFVTAGGFGPVQVSSLLGLGALVALLLVLAEASFAPRLLAGVLGVALATQSLLTFSRGGMFSVAIAATGLIVVLTRDRANRTRIWGLVAVVLAIGYFVVVPQLDSFTDGAFNERFSETETSRTDLAADDLESFWENPVFGVGPGMTKFQRLGYEVCGLRNDSCSSEASSHTEFTRTLGEHGLAGVAALGVLGTLAFGALTRKGADRALAVTFLLWALSQMIYANFRIVAVPLAFAFAFMRVGPADDDEDDEPAPLTEAARD